MIPITVEQVARAVDGRVVGNATNATITRVVSDSRAIEPGDLFVAIRGPSWDGHAFIADAFESGAVACLAAADAELPRSSGPIIVVNDTIVALGKLAAWYRREVIASDTCVIAVTGSNGKTTTKQMIDHVLAGAMPGRAAPKSFNNHIGVPLTLLSAEREDRYLVVEVGTNAPGEIAHLAEMTAPDIAIITSIGEAHLEGLGDIHAVAAEKASLLRLVRPHGRAYVNIDRAEIRPHLKDVAVRLTTFGQAPDAEVVVSRIVGDLSGTDFQLGETEAVHIDVPGPHHATNAAAAYSVARQLGMEPRRIVRRLETFTPPPGRGHVRSVGDITLVDDSYNANPVSMAGAIETLRHTQSGRRVLVMGDMLELGGLSEPLHQRMIRMAFDARIETLIVVGPSMLRAIADSNAKAIPEHIVYCADADVAGEVLISMLLPGDIVWLKGSRAMRLDKIVERLESRAVRTLAAV